MEDGGLSFGGFYKAQGRGSMGSWVAPPHPWQDPGSKFWLFAETQFFQEKQPWGVARAMAQAYLGPHVAHGTPMGPAGAPTGSLVGAARGPTGLKGPKEAQREPQSDLVSLTMGIQNMFFF